MITRPLDLLSKLRPSPRNFDFLFLVNGGLIALFFTLFGSNFVLSPGLAVDGRGFQMLSGAAPDLIATPVTVSINANGQIWGDQGVIPLSGLKGWLTTQAKGAPKTWLGVILDMRASGEVILQVREEAVAAGFVGVHLLVQPKAPASAASGPEVVFPK